MKYIVLMWNRRITKLRNNI